MAWQVRPSLTGVLTMQQRSPAAVRGGSGVIPARASSNSGMSRVSAAWLICVGQRVCGAVGMRRTTDDHDVDEGCGGRRLLQMLHGLVTAGGDA